MRIQTALYLVPCALYLGACGAPMVVGAAATAGYIGLQERDTSQITIDTGLKTRIKGYLTETNYQYFSDIGIDVYKTDVLITGIVPTQADGEQVTRVVNNTSGIGKVYNELFVGAPYSAAQKAKDAWIAAQIQGRLIGAKGVYPINYLVTVVNNHVYVIGSTASADERNHALHILRTTRGVQQVHDYLEIKGSKDADGRSNTILPGDSSSLLDGTGMPSLRGANAPAPALPADTYGN